MIERPYFQSLRGKITNRSLFIGIAPVILLGGIGYFGLSNLLSTTEEGLNESKALLVDDVVGANLVASANGVARRLDEFMLERISDVVTWATAPTVVDAARDAAIEYRERGLVGLDIDDVEERFDTRKSLGIFAAAESYLVTQVETSAHFGEIFFTDSNGYNVALTNPTSDFVQSDEDWWTDAYKDGISVGEVEFDESAGIWSVEISVRITDTNTGRHYGVMKGVLGVSLIQEVSSLRASEIPGGNVTVLNNVGLLLADTESNHDENMIMNASFNIESELPDISVELGQSDAGFVLAGETVYGWATSAPGEFYNSVVTEFPGFAWKVVVQQPAEIAFASIDNLTEVQQSLSDSRDTLLFILIFAGLLVIVTAVILATTLSQGIIAPIKQLQVLADRVSKGDTTTHIAVNTNDEIEDLAQIFDRMRSSLEIILKRYRIMREKHGNS